MAQWDDYEVMTVYVQLLSGDCLAVETTPHEAVAALARKVEALLGVTRPSRVQLFMGASLWTSMRSTRNHEKRPLRLGTLDDHGVFDGAQLDAVILEVDPKIMAGGKHHLTRTH